MTFDFNRFLLPEFNKLLVLAEKRGWVTHEELHAVLPAADLDDEEIGDIYAIVLTRGIHIVDEDLKEG